LLHLVALDLFEAGKLVNGRFSRNGELAFRFNSYWALGAVGRSSRPDVKLPFYHSKSDGFWSPFEENGREAKARDLARYARLDPDYLRCLSDSRFRKAARRTILLHHFSGAVRQALASLVGIYFEGAESPDAEPPLVVNRSHRKRDTRFAFEVLPAYDFTCALTGYRMVAENGTTALDAAHIRGFSDGGPCHVSNGLALSKTAHWLFDRGFWSLSDDLHVLVKKGNFHETGGPELLLKPKDGQLLRMVPNNRNTPQPEYLAWHRAKHRF
jgi:putative restriction endonuclease